MFVFSKNFENNADYFEERVRKAFESAIQNQESTSLFQIRETDRMIQYLEDQPKVLQHIKDQKYNEAIALFKEHLLPAWKRTIHTSSLSMPMLCCVFITMLACTTVECGVPYNITFMQAYIYILYLSETSSEEEVSYIAFRSLFDYIHLIQDFRNRGTLSDIVVSCLNYIQIHLHQKITINEIASSVNISSRQLTRKFKAEMGQTIVEYINNQRISESEYMLIHSDTPITDIAFSIGFSSESYYIDIFKSIKKITPNAYRKKYGKS